MDNFRAFEEDADFDAGPDDEPVMEAPPEIGVDERRMHVRAYNYWVSLLDGRAYPSIEDVDPDSLEDFGPQSVLLDFSCGSENPAIAYIGHDLREECGLEDDIKHISQVPARSLLSRLTDHYLQIIANCAPIGFEAEFSSHRGRNTMYRGILMPLSSDGDTIDFIYGVINWKEVADRDTAARIAREVERVAPAPAPASPVWADGPHAYADQQAVLRPALPPLPPVDLGPGTGPRLDDEEGPETTLPADAALADRLFVARESAENARSADGRSRAALYRALGQAYDFALAAEDAPGDYAEILQDAGLVAQERAPMTPVAKLVFGADYDKTRLTEFAAALSYGRRQAVPAGGFESFVERFDGGLKGVVQAERRLRRPEPRPDAADEARAALRHAPALASVALEAPAGEFVLLIARREPDGRLAIVAPVADAATLDRAIRKAR